MSRKNFLTTTNNKKDPPTRSMIFEWFSNYEYLKHKYKTSKRIRKIQFVIRVDNCAKYVSVKSSCESSLIKKLGLSNLQSRTKYLERSKET